MTAPETNSALVTGASRGIGRGVALELAQQGYALTVSSRSRADLEELAVLLGEVGAKEVVCHAADLADRDGVRAIAEAHRHRFETLNALVLCGGVGTSAPLGKLPGRRIDKTLEVNFLSALSLIQECLPMLRAAAAADSTRAARVLALASIAGVYAEPGLAVYGASKAALISLIETLNAEESGNGVLGTAIAPAFVDTDMAAWTADTVPVDTMIPVADIVTTVRMLLDLHRTTSIARLVLTRSAGSAYNG